VGIDLRHVPADGAGSTSATRKAPPPQSTQASPGHVPRNAPGAETDDRAQLYSPRDEGETPVVTVLVHEPRYWGRGPSRAGRAWKR
jgi:hypothetical protein